MASPSAIALAPTAASCSIQLTKTAKTTGAIRGQHRLFLKIILWATAATWSGQCRQRLKK